MKQQFTEEEIYKDRDSQITAIEKTFEDAQKSVIGRLGWGEIGVKMWVQLFLPSPHSVLAPPPRSPNTTASPE